MQIKGNGFLTTLVLLAFHLAGCWEAWPTFSSGAVAEDITQTNIRTVTSAVQVHVDPFRVLHRTNPLILGNNVQWVDCADDIFDPSSGTFVQESIDRLKQLKITALRFPGGMLADAYHWKDAIGPVHQRKAGYHPGRKSFEASLFGTDEFITLLRIFNSKPIITVNAFSGTPEEAIEWMNYFKDKGVRVRYWEIGNEPYLEPADKSPINPNYPEIFASQFVEFTKRMKAVDPNIQVGLPLRSNFFGRYPGSVYQSWNQKVLGIAGQHADFVVLHNTYYPGIFEPREEQNLNGFLSLLAADQEVERDIADTKQTLSKMFPKKRFSIAITEHNNFFAMPNLSSSKAIASLAGGLYTASLLMSFFKDESIMMANFWSLTGNWLFGALNQQGRPRPQFYTLKIFSDYVGDEVVDVSVVNSPVFDSPAVGYMPEQVDVPVVKALATKTGKTVFVIILNKLLDRNVPVSVRLKNFELKQVLSTAVMMSGPDIQSDNERHEKVGIVPVRLNAPEDLAHFVIPRHSIVALRVEGA